MNRPIFGCIEAGGTKFVLGAIHDDGTIVSEGRVPTTSPEETLGAAIDFFNEAAARHGPFAAFGIASFGPVELDRSSPYWGHVAATPKPGWSGADLIGRFASAFGCPVGFDTDVNGAVLAEGLWGAVGGVDSAVYITVGTGIGGGALVGGRPVHGLRHPEMGHLIVRRHAHDRDFGGTCPFHGDCLEGLASGPAIMARWGGSLSDLGHDHFAHDVIAYYLAQLVVAQQAILSPQRVVMGGGVMATPGLLGRVREHARRLAAGSFGIDEYEGLVVAPGLGERAGLLGALALAQQALA